jgi:uncharacterized protein (DUF1330 family)
VSAYVIVHIEVTDPTGYEAYKPFAAESIALHEGRYLVRGGRSETLEGGPSPARVVILEFSTYEQALAWYHSDEYQAAVPLRKQTADTSLFMVVDGI